MKQTTARGNRVAVGLVWLLSAFVALGIGAAGVAKFLQPDHWTALFVGWGYPAGMSYVVGLSEVVGAIGLLVPRVAVKASLLLAAIMTAALVTLALHPHGPMGWGKTPLIYLVLLAAVGLMRRRWDQRVVDLSMAT
jgi:putative oxidoreductase